MTKFDEFKDFWNQQTTPLHRYNDDKWFEIYAKEINLLIQTAGYKSGAVLETGCGNGGLYPYLDFDKNGYVGVDFSESLLNIFRVNHPGINLACADASAYVSSDHYSLIFSNGVIQYFNRQMLDNYIENTMSMLDVGGILLIANVPWKAVKNDMYSGELFGVTDLNKIAPLKASISSLIGRDQGIGYWYNPRDFFSYKHLCSGLSVHGSLFHPYRFSIILKK